MNMAVAPICFKMCYRDRTVNNQEILGEISPLSNRRIKNLYFCYNYVNTLMKPNKNILKCANASEREKPSSFTLRSSSRENQLKSLDSYFGKSKNDKNQSSQSSLNDDKDTQKKSGKSIDEIEFFGQRTQAKAGDHSGLKTDYDETSDLYIISTMVSINIAVYLFEIASPIKNYDLELFSLPALYGAKINHLILYGEWWRLLTPMFLHTGILHIGFSCWALLTFGPQVCKAYGPFTFFLIYILGGLSGNLTSFLHTPDPTVGGTGPVFAIIGAWLIYQYQNKDALSKNVFESMYQKAIVATAIGFVLSTFGPIDDWTHFGSVFTGIAYGFVTCPTLQIDDFSKSEKENGISQTLVGRNVDPCKSLVLFSIFVMVLGSLLLIFEPPLGSLAI